MNSMICVNVFSLCLYVFVAYSNSEKVTSHEGETVSFSCLKYDRIHKWSQAYINGTEMIGIIPEQHGPEKTNFTLKLESFDNNTEVKCAKKKIVFYLDKDIFTFNKEIRIQLLKNSSLNKTEEYEIQKFSANQTVIFSCREFIEQANKSFSDTQVGLINLTSNQIQTFNTTRTTKSFDMNYNSTAVLCCIHYKVQGTKDHVIIARYIRKKTLLVYDENYQYYGHQEAWMNIEDIQEINIYIIMTVILTVLLLILILIVMYRKCWHKGFICQTDGTNRRVLYADLDVQGQGSPHQQRNQEESPYACIIGELRQNPKDIK